MPTLSATCVATDSSGNPIAGLTINFSEGITGTTLMAMPPGVTDSTGTATSSVTIPACTTNVQYDVHESFAGNSTYAPASADAYPDCQAVLLPSSFSNVTSSPASPQPNQAITIGGTLDSNTTGIADATIDVAVDGTASGSATTLSDGTFSFQLPKGLASGSHSIVLDFNPTSTYQGATMTLTIVVGTAKGPSALLVAGIIAIPLVGVGVARAAGVI
jgi:hypothetical protein